VPSGGLRALRALVAAGLAGCLAPAAAGACDADLDGSGSVDAGDLAAMLAEWGPASAKSSADLDANGTVDAADLSQLLAQWGPCIAVPPWATLLEAAPNGSVVTNAALREAIVATGLAWRVKDTASGVEMVLVPPGSFVMGCSSTPLSACYSSETPTHSVTLTTAFYLSQHEVTQARWSSAMGSNPSQFQSGAAGVAASRPVERVSWNMAQGYLAATGFRLPTEAEWEFAYRAGTNTAFHSTPSAPNGTSVESQVGLIAWYWTNAGNPAFPTYGTNPVGTKAPNALGLFDMSGNVAEWTADYYSASYYASSPPVDPPGPPSGSLRVLRGGSWFDNPGSLRSSARLGVSASLATEFLGFRVARTP
jgi:formylglycine-generating enzyme required for sulfatase activity